MISAALDIPLHFAESSMRRGSIAEAAFGELGRRVESNVNSGLLMTSKSWPHLSPSCLRSAAASDLGHNIARKRCESSAPCLEPNPIPPELRLRARVSSAQGEECIRPILRWAHTMLQNARRDRPDLLALRLCEASCPPIAPPSLRSLVKNLLPLVSSRSTTRDTLIFSPGRLHRDIMGIWAHAVSKRWLPRLRKRSAEIIAPASPLSQTFALALESCRASQGPASPNMKKWKRPLCLLCFAPFQLKADLDAWHIFIANKRSKKFALIGPDSDASLISSQIVAREWQKLFGSTERGWRITPKSYGGQLVSSPRKSSKLRAARPGPLLVNAIHTMAAKEARFWAIARRSEEAGNHGLSHERFALDSESENEANARVEAARRRIVIECAK